MKKIVLGLVFFPLFLIGQTSLTEAQKLIESKQFYKAEKVLILFVNNNPDNMKIKP